MNYKIAKELDVLQLNSLEYSDLDLVKKFNKSVDNKYSFNENDNRWYCLGEKYWEKVDTLVVTKAIQNFLINASGNLESNHSVTVFRLRQKLLSTSTLTDVLTLLKFSTSREFKDNDFPPVPPAPPTMKELMANRHVILIREWFNDNFDLDVTHFVTFEDLRDSYNEWLISRGNSPISARLFNEQFFNHKVFFDNKLNYRKSSRVLKDNVRSIFYSSVDRLAKNSEIGERISYVQGIRFKMK